MQTLTEKSYEQRNLNVFFLDIYFKLTDVRQVLHIYKLIHVQDLGKVCVKLPKPKQYLS